MFDWSHLEELDGARTADELARSRDLVMWAEAEQLQLAAHWADLHAPEFVEDCKATLPGMERVVPSGADGCPMMAEFAAAELAALLGRTTSSGEQLVADAVNLRHRHPLLWEAIRRGEVRVWLAAKVARRCAAAGLTRDQARWVDEHTSAYLATLPVGRFLELVEARIVAADPAAADLRAEQAALARFVRAGMSDDHGMRTLVARAEAGDVSYVVAVIDRLAAILGQQGDTSLVEVRRATALRILANPARALAMLTGASLAGSETTTDEAAVVTDDLRWMRDSEGRSLPGVPTRATVPEDDCRTHPQLDEALFPPVLGGAEPDSGPASRPAADSPALSELLTALDRLDTSCLDPVVVLHVHLTEAAVTARSGVARVEDLGPRTLQQVRSWLADPQAASRIHVRPVLDTSSVPAVDRYEFTPLMAEVVHDRHPYEVFPFGTLPARRCDLDHTVPYQHGGSAPPGQTGLDNVAPLSRKHHRIKTFGRWLLRTPEPGVFLWRTPHGHWFRVDPTGTHHLGRDPLPDELTEPQLASTSR